ncbi:ParB N-terminal domain-containing protein [Shinella sp. M31]|uniref:ParB N-terminal domain-containing protein n=1 Tax=Shinella sp. M31 TaxID=3368615 RepID=UPI003B9FECA3
MAEFLRLNLSEIDAGDRLRSTDATKVEARAASMAEHGQITPISVRRAPAKNKGATPFILVAGGYRFAAATMLGWDEIDAVVVKADAADAQMIEIVENLHGIDLTPIERAVFVLKYRELWEAKHGKIERGGNQKSKGHDAPLKLANGRELSSDIQERLGLGPDTYKRAVRIGQNLHPTLRAAVRGTEAETDQSKLLKLAKLSADDQLRVAASLKEKPDLKLALSWLKPEKPKADPQAVLLKKLLAAWENASEETRQEFLVQIGAEPDGTLGEMMADIKREAKAA